MKGRWLSLIFAVGCIILIAAFAIGYANLGDFAHRIGIMQILMGAIGVIVLILAAMSILNNGKSRWTALTQCSIVLLGFSALTFFSIGLLIAPAALIMLVFSIWKLHTVKVQTRESRS